VPSVWKARPAGSSTLKKMRRAYMNRARWNAIVDTAALLVLLLSLFCGIITWKVLPSGSERVGPGRGAGHEVFLGLARGEWREIHIDVGLAFAALVLLHLVLHWRWILCIPRLFSRPSRERMCPTEVVGKGDAP
jgi:hypothetical protein